MKQNIGGLDGLIRKMLGLVLGGLYFTGVVTGNAGLIFLLAGGALIFTGLEGFSPLYYLTGINTHRLPKARAVKKIRAMHAVPGVKLVLIEN